MVLDATGRVDEIARMLGARPLTDTTRRHADEMLAAGRASGACVRRAAEIPARGPVIAYTDTIAARIALQRSGEPTFQPEGEIHGPTGSPIPFLAVVRQAALACGTGPVPAGRLQVGAGN